VQRPLQLLLVVSGCRRLVALCGRLALEMGNHFFIAGKAGVHILPLIILGCPLPGWHLPCLRLLLHLLLLAVFSRQQQRRTLRTTTAAATGPPQRQGLRRH
jgi:hypothetical protein